MAKLATQQKTRGDVLAHDADRSFCVKTYAHPTGSFTVDLEPGAVLNYADCALWAVTEGSGYPIILAEPVRAGDTSCIIFDVLCVLKKSSLVAASEEALTYALSIFDSNEDLIRFI